MVPHELIESQLCSIWRGVHNDVPDIYHTVRAAEEAHLPIRGLSLSGERPEAEGGQRGLLPVGARR